MYYVNYGNFYEYCIDKFIITLNLYFSKQKDAQGRKIFKAYQSAQLNLSSISNSKLCSAKELTLETRKLLQWPIYDINSVDHTKLPSRTMQRTKHVTEFPRGLRECT